jgi:archaellum biogenesis protein FlaJ (TadC family)
MLDKFYSTKSAKDLKSLQKLYTALLIVAVSLLIIFNVISYFLSSNFQKIPSILFIIIIFWSALNVVYLKKKI